MQPQLIILRGAPGSGKSTFANKLRVEYPEMDYKICEADAYFMHDNVYQFDFAKLRAAHNYCFTSFVIGLATYRGVIVSNTNTRLSELEPYFEVAKEFGVIPAIKTLGLDCNFGNIHGVPMDKVAEMEHRLRNNTDVSSLYEKYFPNKKFLCYN